MSEIGFDNNEKNSNPGEDTHHPVEVERVEVNVFFDGTGNNFYNVTAEQKLEGEASYEAALTNVARMWNSLRTEREVIALYVEGIGTKRNESDHLAGMALGTGETGIDTRVKTAFSDLVTLVKDKRGKADLPATLGINVFGFSRGAAAARYFVHLVNAKKELFGSTWEKIRVHCNFVGLFDTVASYGLNHSNDVGELHLNFEANYAAKVFHLIAGDEYRLNFPVSTIASAVNLKVQTAAGSVSMGYELRIPGAHSDVGGSYNDTESETRTLYPAIKDFVYDQGWYDPSLQTSALWHTHTRTIQAEYHKVGLALMVDQTHLHSTTQFPSRLLDPPKDADLLALHNSLREFAKDEKNTDWNLVQKLGKQKARAIRKRFMHQSFSSGTMAPRLISDESARQWGNSSIPGPQIPAREYLVG